MGVDDMYYLRVLLTVSVVLVGAGQAEAVLYTLTDLGDLPGGDNTSVAYDINNEGRVVGRGNVAAGGVTHAFLWDPVMGIQDLGVFPGGVGESSGWSSHSVAYAINDNGQVVGHNEVRVGTPDSYHSYAHAFLWDSVEGMQDLGRGIAYGINNGGQVVGVAANSHAFLWDEIGGMQDLGTLSGYVGSKAYDINDDGQVVGYCETNLPDRAFLWDSVQGMQNLGSLWFPDVGYGDSFAYGINNDGQVVGQVSYGSSPSECVAFLWDNVGGMQEIDGSIAYDINASGQVVGCYITGSGTTRAMGPNGALNDQLDASGAGWILEEAQGINDAGQIVGSGWGPDGYHAFLLTPIPEPSTLLLAAFGLFGLTFYVWRRRKSR
jgi:probable HAF family extracellular repeat protein